VPVYEHECEVCGRKFDVIATLAEKEAGLKPACPKCGSKRVRQVFGRFTLLTSSKSESDDFDDEGLGGEESGLGGGGLGADEGLDDFGDTEPDNLDDLDDLG